MNMTAWIDVAIGLTIVYLGASLFVTIINEYVSQILNLRGNQLWKSLQGLIDNEDVKKSLSANPALKLFFQSKPSRKASYIDPNVLARMLIGILATPQGSTPQPITKISENIDKMVNCQLKTQLQAVLNSSQHSMDTLVTAISEWADRSLTMLGEGYKRWLQVISFSVGLLVAVLFNLDTIELVSHLYKDKESREAIATIGVQLAEQTDHSTFDTCIKLEQADRKSNPNCRPFLSLIDAVTLKNDTFEKLPIGWPQPTNQKTSDALPLTRLAGWLLTALAVSLGAPFWFDLLNNLVNVRHGMIKPTVQKAGDKK